MVTEEERNELARLIVDDDIDDWDARAPRSPVKYFALKDADRLLAAGYRKQSSAPLKKVAKSCPTRLMDGRNEIRCWLEEDHEGDCK